MIVALVTSGVATLTAQATPSVAAFAPVAATQVRVAEGLPSVAATKLCKANDDKTDFECIYKGLLRVTINVDHAGKKLTVKVYIGHKSVGWKKVEERTFTKDGVQDRICGKAFGHEACVETEINWKEKFASIKAYYDGKLKIDEEIRW
ncbi:MAG: hypothetical protein HOV94_28495 [Saccharothrix sp.]|nr:hypothetical protein [Saccharothrix sp.]